jgi:hypothetical protein
MLHERAAALATPPTRPSHSLQAQALRVLDKTPSLRLRMLAGVPTGEWTRVA